MNENFKVDCFVGVGGMEFEDVGVVIEVDVVGTGGDVLVVEVDGVEEGGVGVVDAKGAVFDWGVIAFGSVDCSFGGWRWIGVGCAG